MLQFALGHNLAVDACLILEKDAVPPARMMPDNPLRLGRNLLARGAKARPR
ncbi:hypothetical protein [Paludibacterium denitrificans]|uniref:hypothetical protein n=1 Tax=Paludibacterium denitrificans TaxID=2675226 RepID=UPI0035E451E8